MIHIQQLPKYKVSKTTSPILFPLNTQNQFHQPDKLWII
jgi:hypothetical protein